MTYEVRVYGKPQCFVYCTAQQHIQNGEQSYRAIRNDRWCVAVNNACIRTYPRYDLIVFYTSVSDTSRSPGVFVLFRFGASLIG